MIRFSFPILLSILWLSIANAGTTSLHVGTKVYTLVTLD